MSLVQTGKLDRFTAAEISEMIRDALAQFRGPIGQDGDLTFVIVKVL